MLEAPQKVTGASQTSKLLYYIKISIDFLHFINVSFCEACPLFHFSELTELSISYLRGLRRFEDKMPTFEEILSPSIHTCLLTPLVSLQGH